MTKSRAFYLVLAATVLFPALARAQEYAVDQGSLLVDGSISLTSIGNNNDEDRDTNISLNPDVQYFVVPGLAVGGGLTLERRTSDRFSRTTYGIGPRVSYYFGAAFEKTVYPFFSANASYYTQRFSFDDDTETRSLYGFGAAAGVLVMVSDGVGLTGRLFFDVLNFGEDEVERSFSTDTFGFAFGIAAFVF